MLAFNQQRAGAASLARNAREPGTYLRTTCITPRNSRSTATHSRPHPLSLAALPYVPSICFDQACQTAADQAFLVATGIPIVIALSAIAYLLRPIPPELADKVFEDPETGAIFEKADGLQPVRDERGEIVFRPMSYTPWPVEEGVEGVRVRVPVGPVKDRQPRTFLFPPLLGSRSDIIQVSLPRPLGIVFEYDEKNRVAVVIDLVEGSHADQRRRMAGLNRQLASNAVLPGDVLRAVTATCFVYPTRALFGAVPPERHVVLYGADKQKWSGVCGALRKGKFSDGEVSLVLERRRVES